MIKKLITCIRIIINILSIVQPGPPILLIITPKKQSKLSTLVRMSFSHSHFKTIKIVVNFLWFYVYFVGNRLSYHCRWSQTTSTESRRDPSRSRKQSNTESWNNMPPSYCSISRCLFLLTLVPFLESYAWEHLYVFCTQFVTIIQQIIFIFAYFHSCLVQNIQYRYTVKPQKIKFYIK